MNQAVQMLGGLVQALQLRVAQDGRFWSSRNATTKATRRQQYGRRSVLSMARDADAAPVS